MNHGDLDDAGLLFLPKGLLPLYGKGFEEAPSEKCSDLVTYAYRVPVRAGAIPPISLAFEGFVEDGISLAFVIGDDITVHGTTVMVTDFEISRHPEHGDRPAVNVWTVYVDEERPLVTS